MESGNKPIKIISTFANSNFKRDVAQLGSVLRSGRRGRKFESCHPDHFIPGHK